MGFFRCIRLYSACFRLAGMAGLIACTKYLCGALKLDEISQKSSDFPVPDLLIVQRSPVREKASYLK